MEIFTIWLQFAVCLGAIGLAGPVMTRSGQAIARMTGMSASWAGLVLLATATSLPELFTGLSAVTIADAPDIAMGNALGSCIFNLAFLALLDALSPDVSVWRRADQGHILTAAFGIILISFVGALVLLTQAGLGLDFQIGHVSLYSPFLLGFYFVAMRAAFLYERRPDHVVLPPHPRARSEVTLTSAIRHFCIAATVVAATGTYLPFVGLELAEVMGWQESFVGTLLIAGATTMPELVVTVSALRMGSADMAIGNLLGSSLFAILVIAIDDIAYLDGSLFSSVSPAHSVTAFAAAIMAALCIVGLLYRPGNRFFGRIGWIGLSLLAIYLFSSYAIYLHGN